MLTYETINQSTTLCSGLKGRDEVIRVFKYYKYKVCLEKLKII